jgi:nucleotide-binding universal stress UspA family protein
MIVLKKILFPTDFSEPSKEALKYALSFAQEYKTKLYTVHVIDEQLFSEGLNLPRVISIDVLEKEMYREAQRLMEDFFTDVVGLEGLEHEKVILKGKPFVEIIKYTRAEAIDLIVIGTHGKSGIEHIIFGSTAEKVVRKAPCPVLSVKTAQREFILP